MRFIKLSATMFAITLFFTGCNLNERDQIGYKNPYPNGGAETEAAFNEDLYLARKNLDLQAVGGLLERADNAEEFEYLLNSQDGVNNLDLNDDGYADYISVREFDDRSDDERGLSLFSMFGPEQIIEIARIFFDRDGYNSGYNNGYYYPGARILLDGNDDLYGDNYYYETNWRDRSLPIVNWLFSDRDSYYRSPYYYGYYPDNYEVYQVVETPVYRTRIEQYYVTDAPVFVYTTQPTITQIKIKSPYEGVQTDKTFLKLAKQSKEQKNSWKQKDSWKNDSSEFVPVKNGKVKDFSEKFDKQQKENRNDFEKPQKVNNDKFVNREKPNKVWKENVQPVKQNKVERPNFNQPRPQKQERQIMRQQQPKPNNPMKQNGGGFNNPNKGGGNPNKGGGNPNKGGGNPNKGGGGKGGGKKG